MVYFIKDAIEGKETAHGHFIRFGRGVYENRAILNIDCKKMLVKGSYDNVKSILLWIFENSKCEVKGKIISSIDVDDILKNHGLEFRKKKKENVFEYDVSGSIENAEGFENISFLLLDANAKGIKFKCKKRLPSLKAEKVDESFFSLQLDKEFFEKFEKEFLFDVEEKGNKIKIKHQFVIDEIVLFPGKDFEEIRKKAKRKGKILRTIKVDGKEIKKEYQFFV